MSRTAELYDQDYLGDGVYVGHDGYHIVMWLESPGAFGLNAIALEPEALRALHRYVERVTTTQGGEMSDETRDPIAAIVREAMDYADRIREALEAWIAEDRPGVVRPPFPLYLDDARTVAALLRTPSGEGEAVRVPGEVERPCDCAGCYCANVGDAEEVGYADGWNACRDAMLAALRSEAPGEAEQGPRAAPLHRYVGQRSPEGYAVCEDCGARENTPAAARMCPAWSSEAPGEMEIDAAVRTLAALRSAPSGVEEETPEAENGAPLYSVAVARGESAVRLAEWAKTEEPAAPVPAREGEETITVPQFQHGDRVMVDCGQYRGPGVVERNGNRGDEVLAWKDGALHVHVRPWIGSWENGYPHSNAWLYPADKVSAARLRGEGGGE